MGVYYLGDENMVKALKAGDSSAFEGLLDSYGDRVLKACSIILKDLPAAEDAVQEVFIQIYKSIGKFKEESSLYTWIYRIAVNKCRDIIKKRKEYFSFEEEANIKSDDDIELDVIGEMGRDRVRDMVLSLSPIYREVITLFYFEDLSIKDICIILDQNEGTVKSKLHRARSILRRSLVKEDIEYGKG